MPLEDDTLRSLGLSLKREAQKQSLPVSDAFVVELRNYSQHTLVDQLDEDDLKLVLDRIARGALQEYGRLTSSSIWKVIQKLCRPKDGYDICAGAARSILLQAGRSQAVTRMDRLRNQLLQEWKLDE